MNTITPQPATAELLQRIIDKPLEFTDKEFEILVSGDLDVGFEDVRAAMFRIFDINHNIFLEESDAAIKPNIKSQRKRVERFYERLRKGFDRKDKKVIVAEGDSWFEFPQAISDIIDHLNKEETYNIYSLAYGGDWLANIIYEGKYVEKLSTLNPDVFLVSGGGNDLVGSDRLGLMICPTPSQKAKYTDYQEYCHKLVKIYDNKLKLPTPEEFAGLVLTQQYIKPAFHSFIWILKLQYRLMFNGIHKKHPALKIITQAYDYAVPSPKYRGFFISLQRLVNKKLKTGKWLYIPMMANGVTKNDLQRQLIRYMIDELNNMFADLAKLDNVYHIDCRGVARSDDDWYDELHLTSERFGVVAAAYRSCIQGERPDKIYFARDFDTRQDQTSLG